MFEGQLELETGLVGVPQEIEVLTLPPGTGRKVFRFWLPPPSDGPAPQVMVPAKNVDWVLFDLDGNVVQRGNTGDSNELSLDLPPCPEPVSDGIPLMHPPAPFCYCVEATAWTGTDGYGGEECFDIVDGQAHTNDLTLEHRIAQVSSPLRFRYLRANLGLLVRDGLAHRVGDRTVVPIQIGGRWTLVSFPGPLCWDPPPPMNGQYVIRDGVICVEWTDPETGQQMGACPWPPPQVVPCPPDVDCPCQCEAECLYYLQQVYGTGPVVDWTEVSGVAQLTGRLVALRLNWDVARAIGLRVVRADFAQALVGPLVVAQRGTPVIRRQDVDLPIIRPGGEVPWGLLAFGAIMAGAGYAAYRKRHRVRPA